MKTMIATLAAGLFAVAATAAVAAAETRQASNETAALFNPDAPRILDDQVCGNGCRAGRPSCGPAAAREADDRCS